MRYGLADLDLTLFIAIIFFIGKAYLYLLFIIYIYEADWIVNIQNKNKQATFLPDSHGTARGTIKK